MFIVLAIIVFCRPFVSSLAFPRADLVIMSCLILSLSLLLSRRLAQAAAGIAPFRMPVILLSVSLLLSAALSVSPLRSIQALPSFFAGLLLFMSGLMFSEEERNRMIAVLALSAAVIAALSVYQFFWGFDRLENFICSHPDPSRTLLTAEYLRTRRTFFPFVTPNALGGYLAMSIPLLLSRRSLRPGLLLTVPALLLTRSIGASLSLLVALLAVFPASLFSFDRRKRLFLLIVPLVVFVSIVYLRGFSFSPTARLGYWKETLSVVAAHPVTGTGTGVFDLASSRYAHNSFLQVWAETGTVGLAALAALLFLTLSSNSGGDQDKRRWLLVSLAAFLLHNLVDFTFFLPEIGLLFWLLLGLYARPVPTPFSRRTIP